MRNNNHESHAPGRLRCAIYTRKSTEEGLEQEFSSLDAQREAAEAFIQSQRREGWSPLPERYDDGGFTGANMDRPALKRLLLAVEAGELDCVVVYKVDRLSRSLLDFTRMLSLFEKHNVSFVAVTQQFNTSTSLGRLTLNILLSFAQFERELIGERTRDKMSAARRKGKWVGGCPVLGYDVDPGGGRLVVNEEEAERVRAIFALFEEYSSARLTLAEIERRGWRLKSWTLQTGQFRTGGPFALNSLRRLLTNILYTGAVRHKDQLYPGEHAAILTPGTWERVQNLITHGAALARGKSRNKHLALLSGLLYCEACGTRMVYSYSGKKDRKYPYYVCLNAQRKGSAVCPGKSLSAGAIEESVLGRIREAQRGILDPSEWEQMDRTRQVEAIQAIVERIGYDGTTRQISIRFHQPAIAAAGEEARGMSGPQEVTYTLDFCSGRQGRRENKAFADRQAPDGDTAGVPIPRIARLMALAIRFEGLLRDETIRDYAELARLGRVTRARMTQIMKLLDLAPDIQEEILFLPLIQGLNERNLRPIASRIDWEEQRRMFQTITGRSHRSGDSA